MDIYTLDRDFIKQELVDNFTSAIWTERYYGDSEVEIVLPISTENYEKLKPDTLLKLEDSVEPMITETVDIEDEKLKVEGISLTKWFNNRFIRSSPYPGDKEWLVNGIKPGVLLTTIVQNWLISSVYLNDDPLVYSSWPNDGMGHDYTLNPYGMGIPDSTIFAIPGLSIAPGSDDTGSAIDAKVPFGPLYDALKLFAEAYQIGIKTTLGYDVDGSYYLYFSSYRGVDRTSTQTVNPLVKFSAELDSLTNIKELESTKEYNDVVWVYPSQINPYISNWYGVGAIQQGYSMFTIGEGFDLKVGMAYNDEISPDDIVTAGYPTPIPYEATPGDAAWGGGTPSAHADKLDKLQEPGQKLYLKEHGLAHIVDGEIVPQGMFKYGLGEDFYLGDIVEIEGFTGNVQKARVTEYIRAQDAAGYRTYPTISIIE